jgi:hypothetical protein
MSITILGAMFFELRRMGKILVFATVRYNGGDPVAVHFGGPPGKKSLKM